MSFPPKDSIKAVACLFIILFAGVADSQILSPLLPSIRAQIGKSSSEMGYLFTGYSFCASLSVLFWGPLSDVFGRKSGLLSGLSIFAAGSIISCLSTGFYSLLAGRIFTGMGASMLSLNTISYAGDYFPYENRGWAMGTIFSSYFAALILGVPLGAWIGEKFGWNAVFGCMGGIAVTLLVSTFLMLPSLKPPKSEVGKFTFAVHVHRYVDFLKKRSSMGALLSSFFASAGTMGFLAFLGAWLHDSFGIPASKTGFVFLVSGVAAILASPFAGSLADRIGKRLQFTASSIALAFFLMLLPHFSWGWMLFGIIGAIGLSAAFRQGPMEAVFTEIAAPERRGSFIALKNSFSQLGIGVAAMLSGILFEYWGYAAVCFLGAVANVLAAFGMAFTLKERHL